MHARSRPSTKPLEAERAGAWEGRQHGERGFRIAWSARRQQITTRERGVSVRILGNQGLSIQIRRAVYVLRLRHATRNHLISPLSGLAGGWVGMKQSSRAKTMVKVSQNKAPLIFNGFLARWLTPGRAYAISSSFRPDTTATHTRH